MAESVKLQQIVFKLLPAHRTVSGDFIVKDPMVLGHESAGIVVKGI